MVKCQAAVADTLEPLQAVVVPLMPPGVEPPAAATAQAHALVAPVFGAKLTPKSKPAKRGE